MALQSEARVHGMSGPLPGPMRSFDPELNKVGTLLVLVARSEQLWIGGSRLAIIVNGADLSTSVLPCQQDLSLLNVVQIFKFKIQTICDHRN